MTPAALLAELEAAGFRLSVRPDGGKGQLLLSPADKLSPEVREQIQRHREELYALVLAERHALPLARLGEDLASHYCGAVEVVTLPDGPTAAFLPDEWDKFVAYLAQWNAGANQRWAKRKKDRGNVY